MSPIVVLAFGAGLLLALSGDRKGTRRRERCLQVIAEQLYHATASAPLSERQPIIAWLADQGMMNAVACMQQHAADLSPCRALIIEAIKLDVTTRTPAELKDLEDKARADGLTQAADCLAQLRTVS